MAKITDPDVTLAKPRAGVTAREVFHAARAIVANQSPGFVQRWISGHTESQFENDTERWVALSASLIASILQSPISNLLFGMVFDLTVDGGEGGKRKVFFGLGDGPPMLVKTIAASENKYFESECEEDAPTHYAVFYFPIRIEEREHRPTDDLVTAPPSKLVAP